MKTPFILLFLFAAPLLHPVLASLTPTSNPEVPTTSGTVATMCTSDATNKPTTPPITKPAPATKTRRLPPAVLRA